MRQIDLDVILSLLRSVGEELLEAFRRLQPAAEPAQMKAAFHRINGDAEQAIRQELGAFYPHIAWCGAGAQDSQRAPPGEHWLYDPSDGAPHAPRGLPYWALSLALLRGGEPVFCAILDVISGELFHGVKGQGAFHNGRRIGVHGQPIHLHAARLVAAPPGARARLLTLNGSSGLAAA